MVGMDALSQTRAVLGSKSSGCTPQVFTQGCLTARREARVVLAQTQPLPPGVEQQLVCHCRDLLLEIRAAPPGRVQAWGREGPLTAFSQRPFGPHGSTQVSDVLRFSTHP